MEKSKKIEKLKYAVNEIDNLDSWNDSFNEWRKNTSTAIKYIFEDKNSDRISQFNKINYSPIVFMDGMNKQIIHESFKKVCPTLKNF